MTSYLTGIGKNASSSRNHIKSKKHLSRSLDNESSIGKTIGSESNVVGKTKTARCSPWALGDGLSGKTTNMSRLANTLFSFHNFVILQHTVSKYVRKKRWKAFIGEEQTQTRELKAAARPGSEIQWLHFSPISTKPTPAAVQHSAQVRYLLQPDVQLRGISAINRYRAVAAVWVSGRAWQGNIQLIGISELGVTWAGWWPHWTLDMGNPLQLDLGNPPSKHHHYHQPPLTHSSLFSLSPLGFFFS